MPTQYRITKRDGSSFTIEGDKIEVDGLGTRVLLDDAVVWTSPNIVEVVPVSSIDAPPPAPEEPQEPDPVQ